MKKVHIAIHQLEKAIALFLDEQDYICTITLAGAAEEILGKHAKYKGKIPANDYFPKGLREKYGLDLSDKEIRDGHLNYARNSIKHFRKLEEPEVNVNWEGQAVVMLIRACINYILAFESSSKPISKLFIWLQTNDKRLRSFV
ncbi:MAG: hypothetical protein ABJK37_02155 [Paraglaciecola sp.]|uniref:hypothetical protein n=1 Tax=Paraglaciecola sp. TaxID=1920173 RepID=UPI0032997ED7